METTQNRTQPREAGVLKRKSAQVAKSSFIPLLAATGIGLLAASFFTESSEEPKPERKNYSSKAEFMRDIHIVPKWLSDPWAEDGQSHKYLLIDEDFGMDIISYGARDSYSYIWEEFCIEAFREGYHNESDDEESLNATHLSLLIRQMDDQYVIIFSEPETGKYLADCPWVITTGNCELQRVLQAYLGRSNLGVAAGTGAPDSEENREIAYRLATMIDNHMVTK